MKNLIRIPLTLTLLFATCCLCLGQEFYRGELFVTGQHFSLTNGHLNVELSVDFEGLKMPSDESLTVTPVLKNGEYEQELPAVLINGTEKQKVYQRTQALAAGKRNDAKVRISPILYPSPDVHHAVRCEDGSKSRSSAFPRRVRQAASRLSVLPSV